MIRTPRSRLAPQRSLRALAGVAVTSLAVTACGSGVTSSTDKAKGEDAKPVTVTNCGRELTFSSAPSSIVGLMPSQTELLARLGAADLLVGQAQTKDSALPNEIAEELKEVPAVSEDKPPAREDLLAVEPDFVVSPTEYEFTAEQGFASIKQLKDNGANAYVATGGCSARRNTAEVGDLFTDIDNLGAILRAPQEAEKLSEDARDRLAAVEDAIAGKEPVTVAQVYVQGNSLSAIGAGVEADIIKTAGGSNVFDPKASEFKDFFAAEINPEEIISRKPDALVFAVTGKGHEDKAIAYLKETFPDVPAVKNDLLIPVAQSDLHPGSLGNIEAVEEISAALYPSSS